MSASGDVTYDSDDGAPSGSSAALSVTGGGGGARRRSVSSYSGGGSSRGSEGSLSLLGAVNGLFESVENVLNELSENYTFEVRPELRLKLRKRCAPERRAR